MSVGIITKRCTFDEVKALLEEAKNIDNEHYIYLEAIDDIYLKKFDSVNNLPNAFYNMRLFSDSYEILVKPQCDYYRVVILADNIQAFLQEGHSYLPLTFINKREMFTQELPSIKLRTIVRKMYVDSDNEKYYRWGVR